MGIHDLKIFGAGPSYAVGTLDTVLFQMWRKETPPLEGATLVRDALDQLSVERKRVNLFIVVTPPLRPPEKETRQILAALGKDPHVKSCAFITHGGSAFWAATMRAVLNSMIFVVPPSFDVQTFARLEEGARFTVDRMADPRPDARVLLDAVDDLVHASEAAQDAA